MSAELALGVANIGINAIGGASARRQQNRIIDQQREVARESQARANNLWDRYQNTYLPLNDAIRTNLTTPSYYADADQNPYTGPAGDAMLRSTFEGIDADAARATDATADFFAGQGGMGGSGMRAGLEAVRNRRLNRRASVRRDLFMAGEQERYRRRVAADNERFSRNIAAAGLGSGEVGMGQAALGQAMGHLGGLGAHYASESAAYGNAIGNTIGSLVQLEALRGRGSGQAGGSTGAGTTTFQSPSKPISYTEYQYNKTGGAGLNRI